MALDNGRDGIVVTVRPAGLVLTGARPDRADKTTLQFDGVPVPVRVARVVAQVAHPVLVVGPESRTGLASVDDPREGPLAAFAAGIGALAVRGHGGPFLLVAGDLPLIEAPLLRFIVDALDGYDAAVPVIGHHDQPLCACYASSAGGVAARLAARGETSLATVLPELRVRRLPSSEWDHLAPPSALLDVDTPEDVAFVKRMLEGTN